MKEQRQPALIDTDAMPFGEYKGQALQDVPASYLLWLWEQGPNRDRALDNYIFNSLSALKDECPDMIVNRRV